MATYIFNFTDGAGEARPEPFDGSSLESARSQMVLLAGDMLKTIDGEFWKDSQWQIDLMDSAGLILCSIMIHGTDAPVLRRE